MSPMIDPSRLNEFNSDAVFSEVIDRRVSGVQIYDLTPDDRRVYAIPGETTPVKRVFSVPELQPVNEAPEAPRHRADNSSRFAGILKLSVFHRKK